MELRRADQFEIETAIIHVLDKNADTPILNHVALDLNQQVLEFVGGHITKFLADEDNLKGKLFNERGVVYNGVIEILESDEAFVEASHKIADYFFRVIKQYHPVPSCDLLIAKISFDGLPAFCMLKLDYQKSVEHEIGFEGEGFQIGLSFQETALPSAKQKVSCGAVIKFPGQDLDDLVAVERIVKGEDGEPVEFFVREVLQANRVVDHLDKTKMFHKQMENWVRKNVKNEMDKAIGIREDLQELYTHQVEVKVQDVANDLIDDQEQREKFIETLEVAGFDTDEPFELDKPFIEKKLKSKAIKTDTGFMIRGVTDLYQDPSKFEIKYNGDGTVNYIIKNVRNISQR